MTELEIKMKRLARLTIAGDKRGASFKFLSRGLAATEEDCLKALLSLRAKGHFKMGIGRLIIGVRDEPIIS